jgi:hypothetical protein
MGTAGAVNPAAYDAYIQGRLYFTTDTTKPASLLRAQHLFEDAIQEDPNFALAYAGLADTYVYLAYDGAMPKEQAYATAKKLVAKALKLDDSIGEAWDTQGALSWSFDWDWDAADRAFSRAIALAPSYSCAHEGRAQFLAFLGRRSEALAEIAQINQLDTSSSSAWSESDVYFELRDYPGLTEAAKRGDSGSQRLVSAPLSRRGLRRHRQTSGSDRGVSESHGGVGRSADGRGSGARVGGRGREEQSGKDASRTGAQAEGDRFSVHDGYDLRGARRERPGTEVAQEGLQRKVARRGLDQI